MLAVAMLDLVKLDLGGFGAFKFASFIGFADGSSLLVMLEVGLRRELPCFEYLNAQQLKLCRHRLHEPHYISSFDSNRQIERYGVIFER